MIQHNKTERIHISELRVGDTVLLNGEPKTVNRGDVKKGFTGYTLLGDPHPFTDGKVEVVLYRKWYKGEVVGWHRQI